MKELFMAVLVLFGFLAYNASKRAFKRGWCDGFSTGAKYGAAFYTDGRWIPIVCGDVTNEWVLCWNDPKDGSLRFFQREVSNQPMLDAVRLLDATNDVGITSLTSDRDGWCTTLNMTFKGSPTGTNTVELYGVPNVRTHEEIQKKSKKSFVL